MGLEGDTRACTTQPKASDASTTIGIPVMRCAKNNMTMRGRWAPRFHVVPGRVSGWVRKEVDPGGGGGGSWNRSEPPPSYLSIIRGVGWGGVGWGGMAPPGGGASGGGGGGVQAPPNSRVCGPGSLTHAPALTKG